MFIQYAVFACDNPCRGTKYFTGSGTRMKSNPVVRCSAPLAARSPRRLCICTHARVCVVAAAICMRFCAARTFVDQVQRPAAPPQKPKPLHHSSAPIVLPPAVTCAFIAASGFRTALGTRAASSRVLARTSPLVCTCSHCTSSAGLPLGSTGCPHPSSISSLTWCWARIRS